MNLEWVILLSILGVIGFDASRLSQTLREIRDLLEKLVAKGDDK